MMQHRKNIFRMPLIAGTLFVALAGANAGAVDLTVKLSGDNEVPPVSTTASGEARISVGDDGSVAGVITVKGVAGTMAHIHRAAAGANGPVIVKLVADGDGFQVPPGTKLDADQLQAFKAGELYVNVHSADHKAGEMRAQLK